MLELGSVPGDLLLLQAFYPFANNINVFLCTAVCEETLADCICRERWEYENTAQGRQGNSLLTRPRVLCWNQMLRDVSSWSRGPLWCGTYINVICTVASAGGRAGTEAQLLALGRWRVQWGQSYPPPLLSALCQCSFSPNMSETCRRQLVAGILLCHCVTCSSQPCWHVVCIHYLTLAVNMFFSLTGKDLLSILDQWFGAQMVVLFTALFNSSYLPIAANELKVSHIHRKKLISIMQGG